MRLFVILAAAAMAVAQAPQAANPPGAANAKQPNEPKPGRVEGSVISVTGEPIPRATLRLQSNLLAGSILPSATTATADDAGVFVFEQVEPGHNYQLTAQRPGFVNARYGARSATSAGTPLSIEEGQTVKDLVVEMVPQGVIEGRITDANGDPIQGAMVMVMRRGYQRGVRTLMPAGTAQTNDQGEYRAANLPPGRVFVSVAARSLISALTAQGQEAGTEGNVTTYYPNVTDGRSAAPLDILPGSELRGIDVRMRQARVYSIAGKAVDAASGAAAGTVIISASPKDDSSQSILSLLSRSTSQTRPDGSFEVRNLAPGTYVLETLQLTLNGNPLSRLVGRMEVVVSDKDVADLVLPLTSGATITGAVRLEEGDLKQILAEAGPANSAIPAQLAVMAAASGVAVSGGRPAVGLVSSGNNLGTQPAAQIDAGGRFTLEGVAPGTFSVNVGGLPAGVYVKSVRFGGQDVTHAQLDLTSGGGGALDIVLSNKAASVAGAVRNDKGEAVAGVIVTLAPDTPDTASLTNGVRTANTDQNGGFQFQGLAPGEYHLAAWEDAETGLVQNREFRALFAGASEDVELDESANQAVELEVIPAADIEREAAKLP